MGCENMGCPIDPEEMKSCVEDCCGCAPGSLGATASHPIHGGFGLSITRTDPLGCHWYGEEGEVGNVTAFTLTLCADGDVPNLLGFEQQGIGAVASLGNKEDGCNYAFSGLGTEGWTMSVG